MLFAVFVFLVFIRTQNCARGQSRPKIKVKFGGNQNGPKTPLQSAVFELFSEYLIILPFTCKKGQVRLRRDTSFVPLMRAEFNPKEKSSLIFMGITWVSHVEWLHESLMNVECQCAKLVGILEGILSKFLQSGWIQAEARTRERAEARAQSGSKTSVANNGKKFQI